MTRDRWKSGPDLVTCVAVAFITVIIVLYADEVLDYFIHRQSH